MKKNSIQKEFKEKCESQMVACQCPDVPKQEGRKSSQKCAECDKNVSANIVGIESPLHFTSF